MNRKFLGGGGLVHYGADLHRKAVCFRFHLYDIMEQIYTGKGSVFDFISMMKQSKVAVKVGFLFLNRRFSPCKVLPNILAV